MTALIDTSNLTGKLSMGLLVSLEPHSLRRILKAGLRGGATSDQLDQLFEQEFSCASTSPEATELLSQLSELGWFDYDGSIWKTHF